MSRGRAAARRLLVLLAASALAHALALILLPDLTPRFWVELPQPLTVRLVEPPPPVVEEAPPAPQPATRPPPKARAAPRPEPAPVQAPPEPLQTPAPQPLLAVPANPAAAAVAPPQEPAPQPVAVTPPSYSAAYLSNPVPEYPGAARRRGLQGVVLLSVLVSETGAPKEIRLSKSSGAAVLDEAASEAVRGWKFVPARQGERPVAAWVEVPIRFRLEGR